MKVHIVLFTFLVVSSPAHAAPTVLLKAFSACQDFLVSAKSVLAKNYRSATNQVANDIYFTSPAGRTITYRKFEGKGETKPDFTVLTLHGVAESPDTYDAFNRKWQDLGYNVISVGLHGSDLELLKNEVRQHKQLRDVFPFEHNVEDVLELVKHLGLHRVAVVGHSMGGAVAMEVAAGLRDQKIPTAVFFGAGYLNFQSVTKFINPNGRISEAVLRVALEIGMGRIFTKLNETRGGLFSASDLKVLTRAAVAVTLGLRNIDLTTEEYSKRVLQRLRGVPVHVLIADEDVVASKAELQAFRKLLKRKGLIVSETILTGEKADHFYFENMPEETFQAVHDFFTDELGLDELEDEKIRAGAERF